VDEKSSEQRGEGEGKETFHFILYESVAVIIEQLFSYSHLTVSLHTMDITVPVTH